MVAVHLIRGRGAEVTFSTARPQALVWAIVQDATSTFMHLPHATRSIVKILSEVRSSKVQTSPSMRSRQRSWCPGRKDATGAG